MEESLSVQGQRMEEVVCGQCDLSKWRRPDRIGIWLGSSRRGVRAVMDEVVS